MKLLPKILLVGAAVAALMAIQRTMPDYATLRGPIVRHIAPGQTGQGAGFAATLTGLTTARELLWDDYLEPKVRTTDGVWLIVRYKLAATAAKPAAALGTWRSPSGRSYDETKRVTKPFVLIEPGEPADDTVSIFELPSAAEITGGELALGAQALKSFDAEVRLGTTGVQPQQVARYDVKKGTAQ